MSDVVLVVDDNPQNLKLARVLLLSEGFVVHTAVDAEDALRVLREVHPTFILMDIQLPGMDGLELTRRLKSDPATSDVLIVAITAYAMTSDERRAREAGCDEYISKPIDTATLPSTLHRLREERAR